ncbi:MAG TPA: hypothetical protein VGH38_10145 [Bryobacteraceae bacterium]
MGKLLPEVVGAVLIAMAWRVAGASPVLWYNGDHPQNLGETANEQADNLGLVTVYDDFTVTSPEGWDVDRVWSNDAVGPIVITQAAWSIRSGVSAGNGGQIVASGIGSATKTPTGGFNTGSQYPEYTIEVSGLNVHLPPGTFWLSVAPEVGQDNGGVLRSYASITAGSGAVGEYLPGDSFWDAPAFGYSFAQFTYDYSMGVGGTALPEPGAFPLLALASFFPRRRTRRG